MWFKVKKHIIFLLSSDELYLSHTQLYYYNQQWNVFSAFNPSKCTHTWSSGQPRLRRPGNSWGFGALLKGLTSVVDNSCRSRDSNPQPRVTSPMLYLLGHDCRHNSSTYHTLLLLLYALPFWNVLIFYKAHRSDKRGVLWLASHTAVYVLWCHVRARRYKSNRTHYKRGICCIQWGHKNWL